MRFVHSVLLALCLLFSVALHALEVGAEQFDAYLGQLKGKNVGLLVNQTSLVGSEHLLDALLKRGVKVKKVFAPEHGFRGDHDAGAKVSSSIDVKTGLPIVSLYGKRKRPSVEDLANIDVVIFDIQDVGARFYTYISSMHYMMQALAEQNKAMLILDRPNPNINYVDGPILEPKFRSFVGMHPIPVLHGLTVGELAQMIVGEGWLGSKNTLDLSVIPVKEYVLSERYSLPVKPSPNLPNDTSIQLYPSLCFFEATAVSVGRGTDFPFQVFGHNKVKLGSFEFTPRPIKGAAANPKLNGQTIFGQDLRNHTGSGLQLLWLVQAYQAFEKQGEPFFLHSSFMDKLAGTDKLRKAIIAGQSLEQIKQSWQSGLENYLKQRQPYLLYKR